MCAISRVSGLFEVGMIDVSGCSRMVAQSTAYGLCERGLELCIECGANRRTEAP